MSKVTGKEEFILSKNDFANLIRTANLGAEINKKVDAMLADAKQKKSDADEYYKEKTKQAKWKSLEEAKAQVKKDSALETYQTMEKLFPDVFKEMSKQILKAKNKNLNHNHDLER